MAGNDILNALSISPQILVSQQLGNTETAIYSVGLGKSVKLAQGTLCNVTGNTAPPVLALGTTGNTGGTFSAGTYYWKVTARSANGETLASNEVSATLVANGTQALSWAAVPAAASYSIYRGTTSNGQNVIVTNVTGTSYTDTGVAGSTAAAPTVSAFAAPITVYLSLVQSGGTVGDGTHRVINAYSLAGNDTLTLAPYIGGAMLGPSDAIAAYASVAGTVDFVLTGTVHA